MLQKKVLVSFPCFPKAFLPHQTVLLSVAKIIHTLQTLQQCQKLREILLIDGMTVAMLTLEGARPLGVRQQQGKEGTVIPPQEHSWLCPGSHAAAE